MHHYPTARAPSFVVRRGAAPAHVFVPTQRQDGTSLVEVGPRLVLAPIRVFAGSFGGATLYHDAGLVLPNDARQRERLDLKRGGSKYERRKEAQAARREHVAANTLPEDELADTFRDDVTGL